MNMYYRAQDLQTTTRLGEALEAIDEQLSDAENERSSAEDDVKSAQEELANMVKELEQKAADEKRLQGEWVRAAEAYNEAFDAVPEGDDTYEVTLISEFADKY